MLIALEFEYGLKPVLNPMQFGMLSKLIETPKGVLVSDVTEVERQTGKEWSIPFQ